VKGSLVVVANKMPTTNPGKALNTYEALHP
jgi:hypothetical protein